MQQADLLLLHAHALVVALLLNVVDFFQALDLGPELRFHGDLHLLDGLLVLLVQLSILFRQLNELGSVFLG